MSNELILGVFLAVVLVADLIRRNFNKKDKSDVNSKLNDNKSSHKFEQKVIIALLIVLISAVVISFIYDSKDYTVREEVTSLNSQLDTVSYLLGFNYAKGLKNNTGQSEINSKSFITAMQRVFDGKESEISDKLATDYMTSYFKELKKDQSSDIRKEGEIFLANNLIKEGVQVTESGLQYKIIQRGQGHYPGESDKVKVHYTGKLIDGTVFDSSIDRGTPSEFSVNQVIK